MQKNWSTQPHPNKVAGAALIEKACRVIDIVGMARTTVTTAALLRETGWPRATLHRIVSAIVSQGFIRHDAASGGFELGFRFMEIAQSVWSEYDLVSIASLELRRLRDMTGETAYLAVPASGAMMGLGKFEGSHGVRSAARIGIRKPMHCTSQGKAILAFITEAALDDFFKKTDLEAFTPHTITDPARLRAQLSIVRQRGFSVEEEEIIEGNRCVGAPVLDASGHPIAAISVAGPIWRLTAERAEQLGPEIAAVAKSIAIQLRARPDANPVEAGHPFAHPGCERAAFYGADPIWDPVREQVLWTDRLGPALLATSAMGTTIFSPPLDQPILGCRKEIQSLRIWQTNACADFDGKTFSTLVERPEAPLASATDPSGRVWEARDRPDGCVVLSAGTEDPEWNLSAKVRALACSPDGSLIYAADPARGVIYQLDRLGRSPKVFSRIPTVSGEARAIAVDTEGRLWATLYDGWSSIRFSADGEIEKSVALPVPRPTGIVFGGPTGRNAFITSARVGLSREVLVNAPLSGRVLTFRVG